MSRADKIQHAAEDLRGRAKVAVGRLTGDRSLRTEGRFDRRRASAKKQVDRLRDALRDARRH